MLALEQVPAHDFLKQLGIMYPDVKAVLCISAHWETEMPSFSAAAHPETIHDFYGFPRELYEIKYPAPGDIRLAERAGKLMEAAGLKYDIYGKRGLDHGA